MKRITRVSLAALLPLLLLMASSAAFGQELPPGPKVIYRSSMPGQAIQGEFELINLILDFAPGSATPPHVHGGPGIATVLTEEIVFQMEGKPEYAAKPGGSYLDLPGMVHTAANKTSSNPARMSYVVALPKGAPLTTVAGGPPSGEPPPGPKVIYRSSLPGQTIQGEFELINLILEFAPGAATPLHVHGGPGIATVIEGEIVFSVEGKADTVAKPGELYLDLPGTKHTAANRTSVPARISYVAALPKGAALTTVTPAEQAPAPSPQPVDEHNGQVGMPHTGQGHDDAASVIVALALVVGLLFIEAGAMVRLADVGRIRRPR